MTDPNDPNARVTEAIFVAEGLLKDAIKAWEEVEEAETELCYSIDELEREIAQRGAATAKLKVAILKTILAGESR